MPASEDERVGSVPAFVLPHHSRHPLAVRPARFGGAFLGEMVGNEDAAVSSFHTGCASRRLPTVTCLRSSSCYAVEEDLLRNRVTLKAAEILVDSQAERLAYPFQKQHAAVV